MCIFWLQCIHIYTRIQSDPGCSSMSIREHYPPFEQLDPLLDKRSIIIAG